MRRILLGLCVAGGLAGAAFGQAGQYPNNTVAGNVSGGAGPVIPTSPSALLDSALGSTRGSILERGASAWGIVAPGTSGLPWVSNGAAADPAYQQLTGTAMPALTGDVTSSAGSVATTIAAGAVTSGKIASGAAASNVGTLGGDLAGTLPNPTIGAAVLTGEQVFTTSGTYTPTAGTKVALAKCVGGGGAGGGAQAASASQVSEGGGGGAGEYRQFVYVNPASQTVTINAGGTGVSGGTGNNGGTAVFGSIMTCAGGSGAASTLTSGLGFVAGGLGGTGGSGGDFSVPGRPGGWAFGYPTANNGIGGDGANGPFGGGAVPNTSAGAGNNAVGCGAGGSGASNRESGAAAAGGNGNAGCVIVYEFK